VFDEIRYRLTEGKTPSIQIESFGTIAVIDKPAHQYLSHYKGVERVCDVAAQKVIKFAPSRNLKREINAGRFDPTRRSFVHHPADPTLRKRQDMRYNPRPVNARPIKPATADSD